MVPSFCITSPCSSLFDSKPISSGLCYLLAACFLVAGPIHRRRPLSKRLGYGRSSRRGARNAGWSVISFVVLNPVWELHLCDAGFSSQCKRKCNAGSGFVAQTGQICVKGVLKGSGPDMKIGWTCSFAVRSTSETEIGPSILWNPQLSLMPCSTSRFFFFFGVCVCFNIHLLADNVPCCR